MRAYALAALLAGGASLAAARPNPQATPDPATTTTAAAPATTATAESSDVSSSTDTGSSSATTNVSGSSETTTATTSDTTSDTTSTSTSASASSSSTAAPAALSQGSYSVEDQGLQISFNSCAGRNGQYAGSLGNLSYVAFDSVAWCARGTPPGRPVAGGFSAFASALPPGSRVVGNAVALLASDALHLDDLYLNGDAPTPHPGSFWPGGGGGGAGAATRGFVDVGHGRAWMVYKSTNGFVGVATVRDVNGSPAVTSDLGMWWGQGVGSSRLYGEYAVLADNQTDYVYAYGGSSAPSPPSPAASTPLQTRQQQQQGGEEEPSFPVYVARARTADAFDKSKWEYFSGGKWQAEDPPSSSSSSSSGDSGGGGGGGGGGSSGGRGDEVATLSSPFASVAWCQHMGVYMLASVSGSTGAVQLRTSRAPEGPWGEPAEVYLPPGGGVLAPGFHRNPLIYPNPADRASQEGGDEMSIAYLEGMNPRVLKVKFK